MAGALPSWNMAVMPGNKRSSKKSESEERAKALYLRLMDLPRRDDIPSNNKWTAKAGVSTSFFTNLQGKPAQGDKAAKAPSEPSIGNLRLILEAAGTSIPEFFASEAKGRLVPAPTRQALEQALADAWDGVAGSKDKRIAYLAGTVLQLLGLPETQQATDQKAESGALEEAAPSRRTTKRA